jgi:hypothetical protein
MALDRSFVELNRASTERIRALATGLNNTQLQHPVGEHWTVAIALIHIAFWERRVLDGLAKTEQAGALAFPEIDFVVNDLSLPFWAAVPPAEAARLAVESAAAVDQRLEDYPPALLEAVYKGNEYWVVRSRHRNTHLDEVDAALKTR